MGCDGGTIPTRDELVSLKKKPEKKDKDVVLDTKWKHCNISLDPLIEPIMACQLGGLFNKESILELLLDRESIDKSGQFDHIRTLKDLTTLKLTPNPSYSEAKVEAEAYIDHQNSKFICSVSGLGMNGRHRFSYLIGCGCVFSERALTQVKSDVCHKCGSEFDLKKDVVVLIGQEKDLKVMREHMDTRRTKAKQDKKAKRKRKAIEDAKFKCPIPVKALRSEDTSTAAVVSDAKPSSSDKAGYKISVKTNGEKVPATVDATAKELRKINKIDIQSDASVTTVYKSIFTTCDAAKNQKKGNWVTFNPQYF